MTTVFIISAPSGSGKSTLVNEVRQIVSGLDFSVSYTTRKPRGSEQNRREYCFVPRSEFEVMIRRQEFLEYADVFGNYYGTAKRVLEEAERSGRDLLLDIDVQGAEQIMKKIPEAVSIFVLPPDRTTLEMRLRSRSQDAQDVIQLRLCTATREIENYSKYDYILVNDRLEEAVASLRAILLMERSKRGSQQPTVDADTIARAERSRLQSVRDRVQPILESFRSRGDQGCTRAAGENSL
jgi:guanylate kinase